MSCFWTNYCGKTLLKFIGEETIHDGGICSSRLQVTVVDVEVLDLDAHEDLVLQFGNVGVADVEVSDVALLLKHARLVETSAMSACEALFPTHLSELVADHLELECVDPAAVDVEAARLLLAGAVGHVLGALVGQGRRVLLGPRVQVNAVPPREGT